MTVYVVHYKNCLDQEDYAPAFVFSAKDEDEVPDIIKDKAIVSAFLSEHGDYETSVDDLMISRIDRSFGLKLQLTK